MATGDKLVNLDSLKTAYDTSAKFTAPMEASSTASAAHATGEHFIYNGVLYVATADIASGATITPNTNCRAVPGGIGGEVSDLKSATTKLYNPINFTTGKAIINGAILSTDLYSISEYYQVTNGLRIHCITQLNTDTLNLAVFNSEKQIIATYTREDGTLLNPPYGTLYEFDLTINNEDAAYFAFTSRNYGIDKCAFEYNRAIPFLGEQIDLANSKISKNAKDIEAIKAALTQTDSGGNCAYIVETKARYCWPYYQEPPVFKNSDPRYVEDGNANNAYFKITGVQGNNYVTVVTGGNAAPADIADYDKKWSAVISYDGVNYASCIAWYIDSSTLGVWPALTDDISDGELGAMWADNMHLTRRGYIGFAQAVFNANPKHCEKNTYIAKWVAGDTVPFTTIGGTMYASTSSQDPYNETGGFMVANRQTQYIKGNSSNAETTGKRGISWEITPDKSTTGYVEIMIGGTYDVDPDIPAGYEINIDLYINDALLSQHVKSTNVFECLYLDYADASKIKIEIYQNKQAPLGQNGRGFRLSSIYIWRNTKEHETSMFPRGAVVGQMFDSWGVYHDGASGKEFSRLINAKAGVTVPYTNHSVGGKTSAWGKAWFFENLQQYHPTIGMVDFGINDANSMSSSAVSETVAGPDGTLYDNKISIDEYAENMRVIADEAKNNGIQLIATTNPLPLHGAWYYALADAGI